MADLLIDGKWPVSITAIRSTTGELRLYVPAQMVRLEKAKRIRRMLGKAVGHDECGCCGLSVGPYDVYCSHCGAELGEVVKDA